MTQILIDTDDLIGAAGALKRNTDALSDAHLEVLRVKGELESLQASAAMPALPADQASQLNEFTAALGKLGPGLTQMAGGLEKYANAVLNMDLSGGRVPGGVTPATVGNAALGVLGGYGAFGRPGSPVGQGGIPGLPGLPGADGQPIASGRGESSGFVGYQTGGEGSFSAGGLTVAGGYLVQIGAGYKASGEYEVTKDGVKVGGHVEAFAGVYAEAWGSIEYGPLNAQGHTSSLTGSRAAADGTGAVTWENGPQADLGASGNAFIGEEWNADASANFGGFAEAGLGAGFKAGLGVEFDVGASFGFDKIGFHADIGASLGIGLELQIDFSFSPEGLITDAFDFATGVIEDPFGSIGSFGSDVFDFGSDAFSTLGDIGSAFGDLGSGLADVGSSIASGAESFVSDVGDFFGF